MGRGAALARACGTVVVFAVALIAGVALHLNVPAARRLVIEQTNRLLAPIVDGRIVIERIGLLEATRVADVDARADDPDGVTVVRVHGVSGSIALVPLLRSLLRARGLAIEIRNVRVERAEVNLDADAAGRLRIARAFTPRPSTGPKSQPARPVRVSFPDARVGQVIIRGQPRGAPRIDADLDEASASVLVAPPAVTVNVSRSRVVGRSLPIGPPGIALRGDASAQFSIPSWSGAGFGLRGSFQGVVGSLATRMSASVDAGFVDAVVDVPDFTQSEARSIFPDWPITTTVAAHATARGPYPRLDVVAHLGAGRSTLDIAGPVTVAPLSADLRTVAKGIDLRTVVPSMPDSDLSASGEVLVAAMPAGSIDVHGALELPAGRVATTRTPAGRLTGEIVLRPPLGLGVTATATLTLREPGVAAELNAHFTPKHGALFVSFEGSANAPRLEALPWLRGLAHGRAAGHATGTYDAASGQVDAWATATAEGLEVRGIGVAEVRGQVRARGSLKDPTFDVEATAQEFDAGIIHGPAARASARWLSGSNTFTDVDVESEGARIRAKLVRVTPGEVRVDGARIDGFGAPFEASLRSSSTSLFLDVDAKSIDLGRVARFARVPWMRGGQISLDANGTVGHGEAQGRFAFALSRGELWGFHDANAQIEVTLDGRRISGLATARVADVGSMSLVTSSM
ncbi:MAG: hypothetical protein ACREJ3_10590, partial [Polyangiaceae bacterium]